MRSVSRTGGAKYSTVILDTGSWSFVRPGKLYPYSFCHIESFYGSTQLLNLDRTLPEGEQGSRFNP